MNYTPDIRLPSTAIYSDRFDALYLFYLVFVIVLYAVMIIGIFRIFQKAGYTGCLGCFAFIPVVNVFIFLYFAFTEWPLESEVKDLKVQVRSKNKKQSSKRKSN